MFSCPFGIYDSLKYNYVFSCWWVKTEKHDPFQNGPESSTQFLILVFSGTFYVLHVAELLNIQSKNFGEKLSKRFDPQNCKFYNKGCWIISLFHLLITFPNFSQLMLLPFLSQPLKINERIIKKKDSIYSSKQKLVGF